MDKTKINIMYGANPVKNRRERSFSEECRNAFEYLLSSEDLDKEETFFQEDSDAKTEMDDFFSHNLPRRAAFVGSTGAGKTAFLQQYFNVDENNAYYIKENVLYFYHSDKGNGIIEAGREMQSLTYAIRKLCVYMEESRHLFLAEENCRVFYDFVVKTKKEVLRNWLLKEAETAAYWREVQELEENRPLSFCLMKVKYYLLHYMRDVTRLVLIFDDIADPDSYRELHKQVYQCMCKYDAEAYTGYQVKVIYGMREEVYWAVTGKGENERFDTVIKKSRLLDPASIFEARFERAIEHGEEWMKRKGFGKSDLEFAYAQLEELNKKFNGKYKTMILQISQYRKEDIMRCYRKICFNQVWIQKEVFCYSADSYQTNEGFLFTNITCIRALACGDRQVYENSEEGMDNLIPNILYNTQEEEMGIHCLLLIKYFVRNSPKENPRHKKTEVIEILRDIFGEESGIFQRALQYLIDKNVITEYRDLLYINSKGAELWDMLQGDSVLFEICREDYYRPVDTSLNKEPSYKLIDSMKQHVIFKDLLQMIMDFTEEENRLYEIIAHRGKWAEYEQYFGRRRMTFYLLAGVTKSIEYSSSRSDSEVNQLREKAEGLVNTKYRVD